MSITRNLYSLLGLALLLAGVALMPVSYLLLHSTPLTASGLSLLILGAVSLVLGRTRPRLSPEASAILLDTGLENIGVILEELGLKSKAVYLPSSMSGGRPQALMPLHTNGNGAHLQIVGTLPRRLIVKYGSKPDEMGLLVSTVGSAAVGMLEGRPGETIEEIESSLSLMLEGVLDLADGVRVSGSGDAIEVLVGNPRLGYKRTALYEYLGSPLASIVASLTSEALDKPVTIVRESWEKGKATIELKALS